MKAIETNDVSQNETSVFCIKSFLVSNIYLIWNKSVWNTLTTILEIRELIIMFAKHNSEFLINYL